MQSATLGPTLRTVFALIVIGGLAALAAFWQTPSVSAELTTPELLALAAPFSLVLVFSGYCAAHG